MTKTKMTDEQRKEARRLASKKWYETHKKAKTVCGTTPEAAAKVKKPAAKRGRPVKKAAVKKPDDKAKAKLAVLKAKLKDAKAAAKYENVAAKKAAKECMKAQRKAERANAVLARLEKEFLDLTAK